MSINKTLKLMVGASILLAGCAHSQANDWTSMAQRTQGQMSVKKVPSSNSVCFDGMLRKWENAGCLQIGYEQLDDGYTLYHCEGNEIPVGHALAQDFFVIAWSPVLHRYARPIPEDTDAVCADPAAIIVTSERD